MSDDWQAGDLALCVDTSDRRFGSVIGVAGRFLEKGKVYRVDRFSDFSADGSYAVGGSIYSSDFVGHVSADAWRFRKIRPDTEPCEEEFVTLLKRMKPAKVPS